MQDAAAAAAADTTPVCGKCSGQSCKWVLKKPRLQFPPPHIPFIPADSRAAGEEIVRRVHLPVDRAPVREREWPC